MGQVWAAGREVNAREERVVKLTMAASRTRDKVIIAGEERVAVLKGQRRKGLEEIGRRQIQLPSESEMTEQELRSECIGDLSSLIISVKTNPRRCIFLE